MAGFVPAIHVFLRRISDKRVVKITPIRIHSMNQPDLPCSRPMFDRFLALNRVADIIKAFCIDQSLQAMVFCKSINEPLPVFVGSPRQVTCDTDV